MVTRTFDYWWIISIPNNDYNSSDSEAFDTFEDLLATRINHDDLSVNASTCCAYHYRISPDCKVPKIIDKLHLHADGSYDLHRYNGEIVLWGNPMHRGMIEDLKDRCPLLFKEEV